ncbi:MAG TPA: translocation/assembly module TamB domain-containing protein [Candidatus Sulfopaludibacter sp.]|jgi:translocation and assembly module TamB|nr:translocation/assembly module TamB domain-containing protein [Candidatus Sulfopaludibacter sp.]
MRPGLGRKILRIVVAVIAIPMLVGFVAGVLIVRTDWFRNTVRAKIVSAVEDATGGKVDIGSFSFDWTHLRAFVRDFTIHGLEPAGAPPLLHAALVQVDLKLTSPFTGFVNLAYLLVDQPAANVIIFPDGRTNIPAPKIQPKSDNKTGVETIVDLAIGKFDLRNGSFTFGDRKTDLNASGAGLRAQLGYNPVAPRYTGEIDVSPLYIKSGNNPALNVDVKLPLTVQKDKISLTNAQLTTPQSKIVLSGDMDHLIAPRTSAHVNATLALDEVRRALGLNTQLDTAHAPNVVSLDVAGSMDENGRIALQSAHAGLGASQIEASGPPGNLQFRSTVALGEIGRLLRVSARPEGTVKFAGNAAIDANHNYRVTGNLDARGVAFREGTTRVSGVSLDSAVTADAHRIALDGLRLEALGGGFTGSANVEELARFQLSGNLHNFDIQQTARALASTNLGYSGIVSGPVQANGDLKNMNTLEAKAKLAIAPGHRGVPVSGHLGVDYDGRSGNIILDRSHIALPHTTADLSGTLGRRIQIHVVARDMADFRPLGAIPLTFSPGGAATVDATVTGSLSDPHVTAQAAVNSFAVEGRPFTRFSASLAASKSSAAVADGVLSRGTLQAQFSGSVGLHNWKPENYEPLRADAVIRNADLRDVLALAEQSSIPATGALTANAHFAGTVGSPTGNADLSVVRGTVEGEAFDSLTANVVATPTAINLPSLHLVAGASHLDATAAYQHAVNDLQRGTATVHVASNQVQLAQFQALVKDRPGLHGMLTLNGDATANVASSGVQIASLNANAAVRGMEMEGKALGDFTATANTAGAALHYNVNSNFAGSTIHVQGQSLLAGDHQTSATAAIANLPIDRVLAVAGRRDLPVKGSLSANAQLSGTLQKPQASGNFTIVNGAAYEEPFTRLQATVNYTDVLVDVPQFHIQDGPSILDASLNFQHPSGDFQDGQVRFHARSNDVQLSRIHTLAAARPGLAGIVQLAADGAATLHRTSPPTVANLNANISAKNLSMNRTPLGELTATATTRGNAVDFNLTSDLARANIRGSGRLDLTADYPVNANVSFTGVTYAGLSPLLGTGAQPFDASLDGNLTVSGPTARTDALRGSVQLTKLEAHSVNPGPGRKPRVNFELHNAGTAVIALANSVVTVQNFHITGPLTELAVSGTASLKDPQSLNLRATGNVKLDVLEAFNTDIISSGAVTLNAAVTGSTAQPVVNGRLQLQNVDFNLISLPNGISNANGVVSFNGTEAVIQNITGQTGGGKVTLAGFASYAGPSTQFHMQVTADRVHIDYPESVTTQADAHLTLAGSLDNSLLSGNVTITDVSLHSHSDVGSILSTAATPPSSASASTGFMGGLHFDVRIQTSPGVRFRTSLTQNLQADANLTLRGSPDHPGMIGRVNIDSGDVVFFGAKYTIDQGSVAFYDPNKVNPNLNVDLETSVQGVDVTISVRGPMDKLKFSYRSDPPLEFQQIVSLLASGKTPTTDPVLAAHQPTAPEQNFEQMGASTIFSQAVANPVSGRLQRLFGVSKLSIDPQLVGGSTNNPQATLTLQQQVTKDITFTYIQDVTQSNPSAIRIEWAISPQFSAVAQRDIYGEFALDFFYKKRFH